MKYIRFSILSLCIINLISCTQEECINEQNNTASFMSSRSQGDGVYESLGYGYDITENYLGEHSIKAPVINVEAFVQDHEERFDNLFIGIIDQRTYAGETAETVLKQLIKDSNFTNSIAAMGKEDTEKGFFSGTITTGFKSNSLYSYSSKYSFAKAEVLKKHKQYLLNTDVETLRQYLSASFLEDLNKYPAEKIVEIYGTHVLTDITVGGKYSAYYRSAIIEEENRSEKTKTVNAGVKYNMSKIGLDANGNWSSTEITETNKKNSSWECHITSQGGTTIATNITISPNNPPTSTIDLGKWSETVDDTHSVLIDVNWNKTYPIYELISDSNKKAELKAAVEKYIESKRIKIVKSSYVYRSYNQEDHFYATIYQPTYGDDNSWIYEGTEFSIYLEPVENTIPLYQYWNDHDHYYSTTYSPAGIYGWKYEGILGYIYKTPQNGTVPLYQYWGFHDHFYTTWQRDIPGYDLEYIVGYVFNNT